MDKSVVGIATTLQTLYKAIATHFNTEPSEIESDYVLPSQQVMLY